MATVAYEIHEQLGGAPGSVVTPIGQGSLLLGLYQGFRALEAAGKLRQFPQLIGVQARACAPIWAVYTAGASGLEWMREGKTVAEGIRIIHPLRGDQVIRAVEASGGAVVAVEEEVILAGQAQLSRGGFYVEPTSAVVIPGLMSMWDQARDPVVLVLTGSGFKSAS
jgi:threonine synthase